MPVIALAGNPNTGKTTLFNALTGEKGATGNWPGVTIQKREGMLSPASSKIRIVDLPGAYSLTPCCIEEEVTHNYLMRGEADLIVNVLNPSFLRRELYFTLELLSLNIPMVSVINMADEMEKNGVSLNIKAFSEALGINVYSVSAKNASGVRELAMALDELLQNGQLKAASSDFRNSDRHETVSEILKHCNYSYGHDSAYGFTKKLDRILLGKYTAFPFLLMVTGCMFLFAFGTPGQFFTLIIDQIFSLAVSSAAFLLDSMPDWADSLIRNGMLTGTFSVLSFLPQVAILYFFTAFIEESGYMARAAFITDKPLRKIGLSGRSVIPMILGLGCTTTAAAAARGVDSERDRKMTVMLTPFVSCGAKMPVYALIASACFGRFAPTVIMAVYFIGFLALMASGAFLNRILNRKMPREFLLELPPYRLPKIGDILKRSMGRISEFAKRAGTVIVLTSAVSWFLTYYTPSLTPAESADASLLAYIAKSVSVIFRPLGFGSWQAVSALISGAFAKESILSSLSIFSPGGIKELFRNQNPLSYLVFILLSPPCASALMTIKRELASAKLFLLMLAIELSTAAVFALFINLIP